MRLMKYVVTIMVMATFGLILGQTGAQAQSFSGSYKFIKSVKDLNYREIKMAVEKGTNVNARDYDDKTTALIIATKLKESPLVQYLLKNGAKPDYYGDDGQTPLAIAAGQGDRTIVALLIKYKADLDIADKNGSTPLITAVLGRKNRVVQLLLDLGADHTLEDYSGRTPLQHAIDNRYRRIIKTLKESGATY